MAIPTITVLASKQNPGAALTPKESLIAIIQDAHDLIERAHLFPNMAHKTTWFGSSANNAEVAAWTTKMYNYINSGLNTLTFSCAATFGSIASCAMYTTDRVRGGLETPNKGVGMQLNNGFRSNLYSYGEKVGTIIHELSHKCIGANDEQIALVDCYGARLCAVMARMRPDLAITNADNWGYYFTSYHTDLQKLGADWKYLTEDEMTNVGPRIV